MVVCVICNMFQEAREFCKFFVYEFLAIVINVLVHTYVMTILCFHALSQYHPLGTALVSCGLEEDAIPHGLLVGYFEYFEKASKISEIIFIFSICSGGAKTKTRFSTASSGVFSSMFKR